MANIFQLLPILFVFNATGFVKMQLDGITPSPLCDCNIVTYKETAYQNVTIKCERNQSMTAQNESWFQYQWWNVSGVNEPHKLNATLHQNSYNLTAVTNYGNYTCVLNDSSHCVSRCMFWFNATHWQKGNTTPANATSSTASPVNATSSTAAPVNATLSTATPANATSSTATPANATSSTATPANATSSTATPATAAPTSAKSAHPTTANASTANATSPAIAGYPPSSPKSSSPGGVPLTESVSTHSPSVSTARSGQPGESTPSALTNSSTSNSTDGHIRHDADKSDENHLVTIIGILVGVVLSIGAILALVFLVYRLRRKIAKNREKNKRTCPYAVKQRGVNTVSGASVNIFTNWKNHDEKPNALEEIPRKNIRFLNTIGKGMFGTVVQAEVWNIKRTKGCGGKRWTLVAIKMTLITDRITEDAKTDFLAELALMKSIPPHANIITLHASCTAHDPYLMILEFASHGDLKKYLQDQRMERNYANAAFSAYGVRTPPSVGPGQQGVDNPSYVMPNEPRYVEVGRDVGRHELLTSRTLLSFGLQISRGLEHLVENKIVHRDVAARNMLLFDHNVVKISDFGLARRVGQADVYERTRKGLLPVRWMSPESLFYNEFSQMSDVWSYGVFLWELVTLGSTPYPGLNTTAVLDKIKDEELLTCPPHSSDVVNDVMLSCWKRAPGERPTFSQLCGRLEKLLEAQVEYVDLDQMDDHEYSVLDD